MKGKSKRKLFFLGIREIVESEEAERKKVDFVFLKGERKE